MSDTQFPNEILLEVFKNVQRSDLSSIASSNRTFCQLARPFLFAALEFLPHVNQWEPYSQPKIRLPPLDRVAEFTKRLEFFTSDQFAPMVHAIYIGVAGRREDARDETLDEPLVDRADAHSLLHLLVSRLECFNRLQSVMVKRVFVTPDMITAIGHISQLPGHPGLDMSVVGCSVADKPGSLTETWAVDPGLLLLSLPAQSLHITSFTLLNDDHNGLFTHWLRLMAPHSLRVVHLTGAWLHELDISAFPVFPNVTRLAVDFAWQQLVYSIIARFPAVQILHLTVHHDEPFVPMDVGPPFPALLEFRGALHLAAAFIPGTTLRRLELIGLNSPSDILSTFANIPASVPATIEFLTLGVSISIAESPPALGYDAIGAIFSHFPNVKDLHLRYVVSVDQQWQMLQHLLTHMDDLHLTLPSRLTTLKVSCQLYQSKSPSLGYDASYDTIALRDRLLSRCQDLENISFEGPMFALHWECVGLTVRESHSGSWELRERMWP
ncbi:hypothetical protein C8F01DRAFT_1130299 [Mycena amicta]|nr:hypothetical protein C8F01DRAFT_1130299 [Mycena amicta]